MVNLERILNLLFRRIPAKAIIDGKMSSNRIQKEQFISVAFRYMKEYSETELENMWMYYLNQLSEEKRNIRGICDDEHAGINVFEILFLFVEQILVLQNREAVCRYEKLLRWRMLTFEVSEDLLVSAFWAQKMPEDEMKNMGYSWKIVIGHNNHQINRIMEKGISENHFHLYGSAPIFHLSWLSLMNNITNSKAAEHLKLYEEQRRDTDMRLSNVGGQDSLQMQCWQAALIRVFLFAELQQRKIRIGNYNVNIEQISDCLEFSKKIDTKQTLNVPELKNSLNSCKMSIRELYEKHAVKKENTVLECIENLYGELECPKNIFDNISKEEITTEEYIKLFFSVREVVDLENIKGYLSKEFFDQNFRGITLKNVRKILCSKHSMEECVQNIQSIIEVFRNEYKDSENIRSELEDYALLGVCDQFYGFDDFNDIFSGERWFLYSCMNRIYQRKFPIEYMDLFYSYVLMKETLRSELLQSNGNVGFSNFQAYQRRKFDLIDDPIYKNEVVRWAVRENFLKGNVNALEIRISPQNTAKENLKFIQKLDTIIGGNKDKYYYVFHFIKNADKVEGENEFIYCRHYKFRKKIKKLAGEIIKLRECYPETAKRLLGIDAASSEIGCRPEVFASEFRYLRNHVKVIDDGVARTQIPQLRITYHVGEDFLDIADGLRAIDEAVNFLQMDCGDRLGHAIALGIDVEEWYASKNNRILIPQQDYLDNIVWMYHQLIRFDIKGMENLRVYIEKEFSYYFHNIYGKYMKSGVISRILDEADRHYSELGMPGILADNKYMFDIFQYYRAWKLRADEPDLYSHGFFWWDRDGSESSESNVNKRFPREFDVRYIPEVFLLNFYYHFNSNVRLEGDKRIQVRIPPFYVKGIKVIQKELQKRIGRKGIGIETNPSSNYLIGTFKRYEKHPIYRLYNKELSFDSQVLQECPQLSVSINTDDMGVFSTSLENEYALLAAALEKAVDQKGEPVYNKSMVYAWLDAVREMGNEQSFLQKIRTGSNDDYLKNIRGR